MSPTTGARTSVASAVAPTYTLATTTCAGVVTAATWVLTYAMDNSTGAATITAASLQLTVSDAVLGAGAASVVVAQSFAVRWVDSAAAAAQLQDYSGAPGYLPGFPVLAGAGWGVPWGCMAHPHAPDAAVSSSVGLAAHAPSMCVHCPALPLLHPRAMCVHCPALPLLHPRAKCVHCPALLLLHPRTPANGVTLLEGASGAC